jgi:LmbE family N-acetylglucosaminyl deacetylase
MIKLTKEDARRYVPDGAEEEDALRRITHLGIGAHQDDLEFMAFHGILACYRHPDQWFGGVTCTNGAGSARTGPFASYTDEQMQAERIREQNRAAEIGDYGVMLQLGYASAEVKDPADGRLVADLAEILWAARPEVVYTHNPADKHETHVAVVTAVLRALREIPAGARPRQVLGCEVWRSLDWMLDADKVALDVGGHDELAEALNGVFASQIAGGKRYDLATMGRRLANATFFESHSVDEMQQCWYAMDLSPVVRDDALDIADYVQGYIDRFAQDVRTRLTRHLGS